MLAFVDTNPPIAWLDKGSLEQGTAQLTFPSRLTVFLDHDKSGGFLTPYTCKAMAAAQLLSATLGGNKLRKCLRQIFANGAITKAAAVLANVESPNISRAVLVNMPVPLPAVTPKKGKGKAGPAP